MLQAELLYRRALDADPSNALVLENYERLERERSPNGLYASAGPSAIARWRAHVRTLSGSRDCEPWRGLHLLTDDCACACGCEQEARRIGAHWIVMDDPGARVPSTQRFYHDVRTGACVWQAPLDEHEGEEDETVTSARG